MGNSGPKAKRGALLLGGLALLATLAGCGTERGKQPPPEPLELPGIGEEAVPALDPAPEIRLTEAEPAAKKGRGTLSYRGEGLRLDGEQEKLLLAYMDLYYLSLAQLDPWDPSGLFAGDAQDRAQAKKAVWETMVAVRKAQDVDLSLAGYSYQLVCTGIQREEGGDISITVQENVVENFAAYPDVDSESLNVNHRFTLTSTGTGWKLRSHSQMDAANRLAGARPRGRGEAAGGSELGVRRQELLAHHAAQLADRKRQAKEYDPEAGTSLVWEHGYQRDAAVAYAMEWVGKRNSGSWPTYDRSGGNCANFTSQCLYAGGIPMDYSGTSQWKWYGASPSTAQAASGRSTSWSSVSAFFTYASSNTGYGLVADAGANFWSGEEGDLIQLGYEDDWRHVVIITRVIRDSQGNAVDYLVNSNTADLRSFPASAYLYPQQRLIKIYGWNSGSQV